MPAFPNLRRTHPRSTLEGTATSTPLTFVDTPTMDYVAWLKASAGPIATFAGSPSAYRVGVVGSGGAGLAAAYELLRCGLNVTVYEANSRVGGRLFSSAPSGKEDGNWFEMGAMRFTPSEQVLHYYADVFNQYKPSTVVFDSGPFPDPGVNLTYIAFKSQAYALPPGGTANSLPPSFSTVKNGWAAFMGSGFISADKTIVLEAPETITRWLAAPQDNVSSITQAWSGYIQAFANSSLYEAVVRIFTDPNAPGGVQWAEEDFEFFGALGTGFGGFGPLFPICFLDIMRFVINAVDSDQHEITSGVKSIVDGFLEQPIALPGGGQTTLGAHVKTNAPVTAVVSSRSAVTLTFADGSSQPFDRVIVATSHRAMELTMGLGYSQGGLPLAEGVADAIRRVHLESSSKVFVETKKFWEGGHLPRNVVGDTLLRNLYTLEYPGVGKGVLLFSYTWAEDSVKQQAFGDPQARLALLLGDLATINPGGEVKLAAVVKECIDPSTAQVIDWQSTPYFYGAFKLNQPGQDVHVKAMFYDFLKAGHLEDTGVYIAGDSVGFLGGWVENALQTGLNAAAAVAVSLGGSLTAMKQSPFAQLNPNLYNYDVFSTGT